MDCKRALAGALACLVSLWAAPRAYPEGTSIAVDFIQRVEWDPVEHAGGYLLEVVDENGLTVARSAGTETFASLRLPAGRYRYRITAMNLLGRPETSGPWVPIVVERATRPLVVSVAPRSVSLGERAIIVRLAGEHLGERTEFALVDAGNGEGATDFATGAAQPDGSVLVAIDPGTLRAGEYEIRARNPGGLESVSPVSLRASYSRSPRVSAWIGWCPTIPVGDSWYAGLWDRGTYPLGLVARADLSVSTGRVSSVGFRLSGAYHRMDTEEFGIDVDCDARRLDGALFYRFRVSRFLRAAVGAGGGGTWTFASVGQGAYPAAEVASIDPSIVAFAEVRASLSARSFVSIGIDAVGTFADGERLVGLYPCLAAGIGF